MSAAAKIADLKAWRSKDPDVHVAVRSIMDRLRVRRLEDFAKQHPRQFIELHRALADMFVQDGDIARYDAALRSHLRGEFDRIDDVTAYREALIKALPIDPTARIELDALDAWCASQAD